MTRWKGGGAVALFAGVSALAACDPGDSELTVVQGAASAPPVYHVGVRVYTVEPGFTPSMMTSALAFANPIWAAAGIQFDFNPSTDVINSGPSNCLDATLGAFGDTVVGKIAIFYCPSRGHASSGGPNAIAWAPGGASLAHELGHYFHLDHPFAGGVDPEDRDVATGSGRISAESYIRQQVEAQCPGCTTLSSAQLQTGFTFRDNLLNADGLIDTGLTWEAPPARAGALCAPSYYVSINVHFTRGQVFDYGYAPARNNVLGYFDCTPTIPLTLSNSQIAIAQHALRFGNRSHLIPKPLVTWNGAFSNANGWNLAQNYSTIRFPDIDGNGLQDVCGRGSGGLWCGISSGTVANPSFSGPTLWNGAFSDANGWNLPQYYSTIGFPEINGTGGADVCGRGSSGIWCGISTGSSFSGPTLWTSSFADAGGWDQAINYSTLRYPDVDGNRKFDVCARHTTGVYCATSTGTSFNNATIWSTDLNDPSFNQPQYYSTVRFPNVNGVEAGNVERADMCARGSAGVYCAVSNGSAFTNFALWTPEFSDAAGFTDPKYYQTIGYPDLNRDRKADICARGAAGIYCALSTGTGFGPLTLWSTGFSDAAGFDLPQYYTTLSFPDLDHDGQSDVCARGPLGMYCANSNGSAFVDYRLYTTAVAGGSEWDQAADYTTLSFQNIDGDVFSELCGRSSAGIVCEQP